MIKEIDKIITINSINLLKLTPMPFGVAGLLSRDHRFHRRLSKFKPFGLSGTDNIIATEILAKSYKSFPLTGLKEVKYL